MGCLHDEPRDIDKGQAPMPHQPSSGANPRARFCRTAQIFGEGDYMWEYVPVTEDGKPVVREITDEDLDELGPAVMEDCGY